MCIENGKRLEVERDVYQTERERILGFGERASSEVRSFICQDFDQHLMSSKKKGGNFSYGDGKNIRRNKRVALLTPGALSN